MSRTHNRYDTLWQTFQPLRRYEGILEILLCECRLDLHCRRDRLNEEGIDTALKVQLWVFPFVEHNVVLIPPLA
jgi:hypothetical protein